LIIVDAERTDQPTSTPRRLTVRDAADALGISEGAVRMRVKRSTLRSVREGGRLYVLLERDHTTDRTSELIATLQEQLQAERQAHAEARRIIAGLVERIPAIEAPTSEATPQAPETVEEDPERAEPHSDAPGAQEGARERRPWWRRLIGG
jgi:DNA-binding Lrp family transcriptional regulator